VLVNQFDAAAVNERAIARDSHQHRPTAVIRYPDDRVVCRHDVFLQRLYRSAAASGFDLSTSQSVISASNHNRGARRATNPKWPPCSTATRRRCGFRASAGWPYIVKGTMGSSLACT